MVRSVLISFSSHAGCACQTHTWKNTILLNSAPFQDFEIFLRSRHTQSIRRLVIRWDSSYKKHCKYMSKPIYSVTRKKEGPTTQVTAHSRSPEPQLTADNLRPQTQPQPTAQSPEPQPQPNSRFIPSEEKKKEGPTKSQPTAAAHSHSHRPQP